MSVQLHQAGEKEQLAGAEIVIRCEQLSKRYPGGTLAVDGLNLTVRHGEIFGLLGPNGAGKTTTVGMLTSLVIPTGGIAEVAGLNVVEHPSQVKAIIGVVSQSNNLDRSLNVWENLYYHGRLFGMKGSAARAAADDLLQKFRLTDKAKAEVSAISGGMAKRLQIARALLHGPSVLFLDEPTAGLDPQSRIALWEILGQLHGGGQTIMITTHYMEEADTLCDRLAIMDHGKTLAVDTPRGLKNSVGVDSIVSISALGDLSKLAEVLKQGIPEATKSQQLGDTLQISVKGASGLLPKVVDLAEKAGFSVTDLSIAVPTLETVFINLTGKELRD
jgi:ABC-2 type transport system ATP-binding protein